MCEYTMQFKTVPTKTGWVFMTLRLGDERAQTLTPGCVIRAVDPENNEVGRYEVVGVLVLPFYDIPDELARMNYDERVRGAKYPLQALYNVLEEVYPELLVTNVVTLVFLK